MRLLGPALLVRAPSLRSQLVPQAAVVLKVPEMPDQLVVRPVREAGAALLDQLRKRSEVADDRGRSLREPLERRDAERLVAH